MKILVPTDFSANSKSGVRFAIHWATQQKMELVFIHVLYVLRGTRWSEAYFEKYAAQEEASCKTIFFALVGVTLIGTPGVMSF